MLTSQVKNESLKLMESLAEKLHLAKRCVSLFPFGAEVEGESDGLPDGQVNSDFPTNDPLTKLLKSADANQVGS